MRAIHQLLPVLSPGDAIGNAVLRTQAFLRALGHESEIFADVIHQKLMRHARDYRDLPTVVKPEDAVMYHLGVGSPVATIFARLRARRIVVYHNITPARYFEETNPLVVHHLDRGREDLAILATRSQLCIADSEYNAKEARRVGYQEVVVIPPPVDVGRLGRPDNAPTAPPYALFVGRVALNKRHDILIKAMAALRFQHSSLRLVMAGTADDTAAYVAALQRLIDELGVADSIELRTSRASDREVGDLYRGASMFVSASEHEGFCVPLVEAMEFGVPIVARVAAAIPDTLGAAGLLIDDDDPLLWAAAMQRVLDDTGLRAQLIDAGRRRRQDFSDEAISGQLRSVLAAQGLTGSRNPT